jgi:23S rRNA U2552 (ribose-2'-O)-methylase RlmE/FtsJ
MDEWTSEKYVIELKNEIEDKIEIEEKIEIEFVKFSDKPSRPSLSLVDESDYAMLNKTKNEIPSMGRNWNRWSKLINPFEKIKSINKNSKDNNNNNIDSRAYYKIYEIIKYFSIIEPSLKNGITRSFHFCEAPGGFIQCMIDTYPGIKCFAQSLYVNGLQIYDHLDPSMWVRDGDGTGSLYKYKNIDAIAKKFENEKFNFITADGGFDVSIDPNNQEQYHLHLITCEVFGALKIQALGGSFVCKIFDTVTKPTCQLIQFLMKYYSRVFLYKPRTSRFSNSEKYIMCLNFKGLDTESMKFIDSVLITWKEKKFCRDFGIILKESFAEKLFEYNKFIIHNQIKFIEESQKAQKFNFEQISALEAKQNKRANEFCVHFSISEKNNDNNISCNHFSNESGSDNIIKRCIICDKLYL